MGAGRSDGCQRRHERRALLTHCISAVYFVLRTLHLSTYAQRLISFERERERERRRRCRPSNAAPVEFNGQRMKDSRLFPTCKVRLYEGEERVACTNAITPYV